MIPHYSRRRALALAGLAATVPVLAACSSDSSSSGSSTPTAASDPASATSGASGQADGVPTSLTEGLGSGEADDVFPRTVHHLLGETTIEAAPTRVVVIATGQLDGVLTLGLTPVGSTSGDGAKTVPDYLPEAFPDRAAELAAIEDIGSRRDPSTEAVGNLAPDLILMNSSIDGADAVFESMSGIAPTVVTKGTGQYWKHDFLLLADALGRADAAQAWLDSFHADARTAGESIDDATRVSLLRRNADRIRVFGPVSFAGSVLADMGVARPDTQTFTDDTSLDISEEQLDQADGDWILYGVQGEASELTGLALWPSLGAVAADRAVQVDDDPFYLNAGPTAARLVLSTVSETVR